MSWAWLAEQTACARPDGSPLELIFQVPQQLAPNVQASELIVKYWQDVSLDVNLPDPGYRSGGQRAD
ncbi:MAG: hypothetical protein IPK19_24530 [Chloroflexi bacterium]|nr:hypothetical protein [Chloroflexota bacterium]